VKLLLLSLLAAAAPPSTGHRGSADDAREILRIVTAFQVQVHRAAEIGPPPCVRPRVGKASLGGARKRIEAFEAPRPVKPMPPVTRGPVTVINSAEIRLSPFRNWRRLADEHPGGVEMGDELPSPEAKRLGDAERALMMAPLQPRRVKTLDAAWLDAPLAFCPGSEGQPELAISSPAISGGFAFVEVEFHCVLCGQGVTLALARRGGGWEIVAAAHRWVS
jgi:hypothetical protein